MVGNVHQKSPPIQVYFCCFTKGSNRACCGSLSSGKVTDTTTFILGSKTNLPSPWSTLSFAGLSSTVVFALLARTTALPVPFLPGSQVDQVRRGFSAVTRPKGRWKVGLRGANLTYERGFVRAIWLITFNTLPYRQALVLGNYYFFAGNRITVGLRCANPTYMAGFRSST